MTLSPTTSMTLPIDRLRASLKGRVITAADADYDAARALFVGGFDRHPAAIVKVVDAPDVAAVVTFARETGAELAVRSGGHSGAGHSGTDGGVVIDLGEMKGLDIDPVTQTAWAETGLTAGEFTTAAAVHGLATPFGDTASVGIGGLTTGGGVGYLVRKHGLTIDSLLAAEIVTADGTIRRVDADHDPDLFWAIRGGGGNVGVATRFQYRLHALGDVVGGLMLLPATAEVVEGFIREAEASPEELSAIANVMPVPPMPFVPTEWHGKLGIMALMIHAGDLEAGQAAVARFRALATPIADMTKPMSYPEIYGPEDPDYHPTAVGRTMFIDHVDRPTAETIMSFLERSDASMRVAQLRVMGGAAARVPDLATAYAHRSSRILVNIAAFYEGPNDRQVRESWASEFAAALRQGDDGAYVNFVGDEGEAGVRAAYPAATWDRLARIKATFDPGNLFHLNQNVPPATAATG